MEVSVLGEKMGGKVHRHRGAWRRLKLSDELWRWLREGVPLALGVRKPPPRRIRPVGHPKKVQKILDEYIQEQLQLGFVEETKEEPTVTSPIFAIPKRDSQKWRIIIDLRYVNRFQQPGKFRSESFDQVRLQIRRDDWMMKGDLKHGFHHLQMRKEHQAYLGFRIGEKWYRYTTMPMGSNNSPYIFCKILRPVIEHIREKMGIRIVWYVDDFLILGTSKEEAENNTRKVLNLLEELGWTINREKSTLEAAQKIEFLGFQIETEDDPIVRVPYQKKRKAKKEVLRLLKAAMKGPVKVAEVARVAGLCQSLTTAIAVTPVFLRNLLRCIPKSMSKEEWKQKDTFLCRKAMEDLLCWLEILYTWNGEWLIPQPCEITMNTDASDYGWGACINETGEKMKGKWSKAWRERHINAKELQAVLEAIRRKKDEFRGKNIRLRIDNKVAMAYVNRMTGRIPELAEIARKITLELQQIGAKIQAVYIGTKENTIADELSRETDSHDWEVKEKVFQDIERLVGRHTVDRFASKENNKVERFNSRTETAGGEATDALTVNWQGEVNWIVPPIPLLPKVALKILREKPVATIVTPMWPAQVWYQVLKKVARVVRVLPMSAIRRNGARWGKAKWRFVVFRTYGV